MFEDAGRRAGEAAYEKSHELYDGGRDLATSFAHGVEDYVRQQPIRSILITVGIVCLFTAAFVRR
jgi:hypothetical protein